MPHRRRIEKGSFGGQLDELIKVFPHKPAKGEKLDEGGERRSGDGRHINDRLFENAWRKARAKNQSSRFSNQ